MIAIIQKSVPLGWRAYETLLMGGGWEAWDVDKTIPSIRIEDLLVKHSIKMAKGIGVSAYYFKRGSNYGTIKMLNFDQVLDV